MQATFVPHQAFATFQMRIETSTCATILDAMKSMGNPQATMANIQRLRSAFALWAIVAMLLGELTSGRCLAEESTTASDAEANSEIGTPALQEIVVTAQKRPETANTIPMSITAATGVQLAEQGIAQPRDLVKLVPSFTYTDSYIATPIYTLRGVGFSDISLGGRATVSIYSDEAPLPFAIETRGASLDLERVEVLEGPQGTLFGQNATGGAINYIDAKPTNTLEVGANVSYGNYNAYDTGGFISGPLTDTLTARLAVDRSQSDGWQQSYTTGATIGAVDFDNLRLLLAWTPDDRVKVQLNINGWMDHSESPAAQVIAIDPEIPAFASLVPGLLTYPLAPHNDRAADWTVGPDYRRDNDFFQTNLRFDFKWANDLTLTSISSYSRYTEYQPLDVDGTALSNFSYLTTASIKSFSQELRVTGDYLEHGHFVVGTNYAYDRVLELDYANVAQSTTSLTFTPLGLPPFSTFTDSDNQDENTRAAFAGADYKITDAVKIYGGARFTQADDNFNGCTADAGDGIAALDFGSFQNYVRSLASLPPNAPIPPGRCVTANAEYAPVLTVRTLDQNNVSWRAGAQWAPTERTLLYANVSKGYKAGGFPDLAATAASQYQPVIQESLVAYEGGLKLTLLERTLQVNGAVFHYDYRNKQILGFVEDPVFGPLEKLVNIPKSEIDGAELQLQWAPLRGLNISAGASYIESKILDNFTNYNPYGVEQNFNGEAFPNTPKWKFVSDVDYHWGLTDSWDGVLGGNATRQNATNSELGGQPLFAVNAYTIVDLRAGVESKDGAWRVALWGRNVGDTYYWTSVGYVSDTITRYTGMPATYGISLNYRYR
jgi:outer membrane receptor protein involved in Fe transport